jgi:hypothetical protein
MKPTMLLTRGLATVLALALLLAVTVQAAPPPEPEALRVEIRPLEAPARVEAIIPVQGRLTDASGTPVADANYDMTFRVYDGSGVQCTVGPTAVHTERGLFNANLSGCSPDIFDGRFLTLGVKVDGDAEMTPVLVLRPVPYAMSLRPGSIVANYEAGHALTAKSTGAGGASTALLAENTNSTGGIAFWGVAAGDDATVISSNTSTGALYKGFGGNGGEDEFRVNNDGSIWSAADTFWHVPGIQIVGKTGGTQPVFQYKSTGAVDVTPIAGTQAYVVLLPISLPTILYGGQVQIEGLSVYYKVSETQSYINRTRLIRASGTGTEEVLADSTTDQNSTSYTAYPLSVDTPLGYGSFVTLELTLFLWEDWSVITVGGVDIQLGHHALY